MGGSMERRPYDLCSPQQASPVFPSPVFRLVCPLRSAIFLMPQNFASLSCDGFPVPDSPWSHSNGSTSPVSDRTSGGVGER